MPTTYVQFFGGPVDGIVMPHIDAPPLARELMGARYGLTTRDACPLCLTNRTREPAYQFVPPTTGAIA